MLRVLKVNQVAPGGGTKGVNSTGWGSIEIMTSQVDYLIYSHMHALFK